MLKALPQSMSSLWDRNESIPSVMLYKRFNFHVLLNFIGLATKEEDTKSIVLANIPSVLTKNILLTMHNSIYMPDNLLVF